MNKVFNKCTPKCINCQTSGCFLKQTNSVLSIVINFETEEIIYEYSSKGLPSYIRDKNNGLIDLMEDTISDKRISKIKKYESLKVESFGDFLYNRKEY